MKYRVRTPARARARNRIKSGSRRDETRLREMKHEERRKQGRAILHGTLRIAREFSRRIPREVAASFRALLYYRRT